MIHVGEEYTTQNGTYIISSYKPHPSETENYGVKRTYIVHKAENFYRFVGRYFSLKEARKAIIGSTNGT